MKPRRISVQLLRSWPLPALDEGRGKVGRGRALVLGGSVEVPGAALLAGLGVLRAGAGTVQIATVRSAAMHVAVAIPEARVIGLRERRNGEIAATGVSALRELAADCDALLVGPGMRDATASKRLLSLVRRRGAPTGIVVDAGALLELPANRSVAPWVLTPHVGEAARMAGIDTEDVERRPLETATHLARRFGAVVVLKGARTFVVDPRGDAFDNVAGNIGLGTSGSGDTLAGVIAGLCARGASPIQAAVWGVHAHAKAGERLAREIGEVGYLARELLSEVPVLISAWSR